MYLLNHAIMFYPFPTWGMELPLQDEIDLFPYRGESTDDTEFTVCEEAYEVLKDPEKRQAYDQLGSNWQAGQGGFNPPPNWNQNQDFGFNGGGYTSNESDFSDFFEDAGIGIMPGCTCHNNAGSGRFKVIQAFAPVIIRTSIRHQEYKGTPVTFSVSRRFLYFFGNGAGREGKRFAKRRGAAGC